MNMLDIAKIAEDCGFRGAPLTLTWTMLNRFGEAVAEQAIAEALVSVSHAVAEEREACAKVCEAEKIGTNKNDHEVDRAYDRALNDAANAIRMRSNVEVTGLRGFLRRSG